HTFKFIWRRIGQRKRIYSKYNGSKHGDRKNCNLIAYGKISNNICNNYPSQCTENSDRRKLIFWFFHLPDSNGCRQSQIWCKCDGIGQYIPKKHIWICTPDQKVENCCSQ